MAFSICRHVTPRNLTLSSPAKYFYWTRAGNGLKLEKRKPDYEYIGFIMPKEWLHLRGHYDDKPDARRAAGESLDKIANPLIT